MENNANSSFINPVKKKLIIYSVFIGNCILAAQKNTMDKLKKRWGLTSNWQVLAIILAFSVNGSFASYIAKPITELIGISSETHGWIFWMIRIPLIFVVYQITLPLSGWIFGQFKFFWNMEKKMLMRMGFKRFFSEE